MAGDNNRQHNRSDSDNTTSGPVYPATAADPTQPSPPMEFTDPFQPDNPSAFTDLLEPPLNETYARLLEERENADRRGAEIPLPEGTHIEAGVIAGVNCERVTVGEIPSDKLIMMMHGGGFRSGSILAYRALAARLSQTAEVHVLLVEYRLAPEHPFPAALDDGVTVYRGLLAGSTRPQILFLLGDSAGANLVAAMLLTLRAHGDLLPQGAMLLSPWLDLSLSGESLEANRDRDGLTPEMLVTAVSDYLDKDSPSQPTDPLISPVFADLTGLPPMLIQVGDQEILLDDSLRFAEKAQADGVEVTLEVWPQMQHCWHGDPALPEAQEALDAVASFVRIQLARNHFDIDQENPDVERYDGSL